MDRYIAGDGDGKSGAAQDTSDGQRHTHAAYAVFDRGIRAIRHSQQTVSSTAREWNDRRERRRKHPGDIVRRDEP